MAEKRTDGRTDGRTEHEACHVVAPTWRVLVGDVREQLAVLPDASVQCVVTSPPYWGLRDYGTARWEGGDEACDHTRGNPRQDHSHGAYLGTRGNQGATAAASSPQTGPVCRRCGARRIDKQIGVDASPADYVRALVGVFSEVWRVLRPDGTLWLNLGDSYQNAKGQSGGTDPKQSARRHGLRPQDVSVPGLKPKDLVGIPWMVAFALRDAGWYLRRDIIWAKGLSFLPAFSGAVKPEAATDRPTTSHEYVFLFSKQRRYFSNFGAIKEQASLAMGQQVAQGYNGTATKDYAAGGAQDPSSVKARIIANRRKRSAHPRGDGVNAKAKISAIGSRQNPSFSAAVRDLVDERNVRSVWVIPIQQYPDAHFATFPELLPEKCIKAGSRLGDIVLDPFCGSGTTGQVAIQLGRSFVGIELNPTYAELARKRIGGAAPLFAEETCSRS